MDEPVAIDHYPDSYWLGQNEDPMILMLDCLETGGSWEDLPSEPEPIGKTRAGKTLGAGN